MGSLNDLFESVSDRLRDSGRLIVVDEAENLPLRALEIVRRLHDETGCGLVLSGMPRLVANLRGKHGELVQLYSRVSVALNLGESLPDDELFEIAKAALPDAVKHLLPDSVQALITVIGFNETLELVRLMGGTTYPLRQGYTKNSQSRVAYLEEIIGSEAAGRLLRAICLYPVARRPCMSCETVKSAVSLTGRRQAVPLLMRPLTIWPWHTA